MCQCEQNRSPPFQMILRQIHPPSIFKNHISSIFPLSLFIVSSSRIPIFLMAYWQKSPMQTCFSDSINCFFPEIPVELMYTKHWQLHMSAARINFTRVAKVFLQLVCLLTLGLCLFVFGKSHGTQRMKACVYSSAGLRSWLKRKYLCVHCRVLNGR